MTSLAENERESDEFDLIDAMIAALDDTTQGAGVVAGPGDDAAVLDLPPGHQLVVSTDTLIAGRHYPAGAAADVIGYRSMAAATSDLAAMGATPAWAMVSLTVARLTAAWAQRYAQGVAAAARAFGLAVVGGNVARGSENVTVTVHGHVPTARAMLRSGAKPGHVVYVTGTLGGARLALQDNGLSRCSLAELDADSPRRRYWKPEPRLAVGIGLRALASAAIDLSDGLSSDLEHLCRASGIACDVELARLPVYPGGDPMDAAAAGDDYELAFTAPPDSEHGIRALARETGVAITPIATARTGRPAAVHWFRDGLAIDVSPGYRHF